MQYEWVESVYNHAYKFSTIYYHPDEAALILYATLRSFINNILDSSNVHGGTLQPSPYLLGLLDIHVDSVHLDQVCRPWLHQTKQTGLRGRSQDGKSLSTAPPPPTHTHPHPPPNYFRVCYFGECFSDHQIKNFDEVSCYMCGSVISGQLHY